MWRRRRPWPGPCRIPVIASGGVGRIADIEALIAASEPNIEGVVIGRALYDGRIDPAEALALAQLRLNDSDLRLKAFIALAERRMISSSCSRVL